MLQIVMIARSNWRSRWIVMARCIQSMVMHVLMCVGGLYCPHTHCIDCSAGVLIASLHASTKHWTEGHCQKRYRVSEAFSSPNHVWGKTPNLFYSIPKMPYLTVMPGFWYLEVTLVAQITVFFFAKHGQWTFSKHCDQRVHACNRQRSLFVQWCILRVVLIGWQCELLNANRRLLSTIGQYTTPRRYQSISCNDAQQNWAV